MKKGKTDETGRECSRCGKKQDWSEYTKQKGGINGRRPSCKTCQKEVESLYTRDPEKHKQAMARYNAKRKKAPK